MKYLHPIHIPSAVAVQRLGPGDTRLGRAMNMLFAAAFEDAPRYVGAPPDDSYLNELLVQSGTIAIVAIADDAVMGALTAYALPKFEQACSEIYIYDLAVAENWRRQGVATALIGEVIKIARSTGACAVFVQADYGDDPAIALYTKLGTRENVMHFDFLPTKGERG
jgi:aminoglycoside 3-N-acetyltransferase I